MKGIKGFCVAVLVVLLPVLVSSEEISNYAKCDVCDGAIHLTVQETVDLLGFEGVMAIRKMPVTETKSVSIDLDGQLKNGTTTTDEGYEIKIWGSEVFYIKDLRDQSTIQMITTRKQASNFDDMQSYQPHIYLYGGHDHSIELSDTVDVAWKKMKQTRIYQWVGKSDNKGEWLINLQKKIFQAIELMATSE